MYANFLAFRQFGVFLKNKIKFKKKSPNEFLTWPAILSRSLVPWEVSLRPLILKKQEKAEISWYNRIPFTARKMLNTTIMSLCHTNHSITVKKPLNNFSPQNLIFLLTSIPSQSISPVVTEWLNLYCSLKKMISTLCIYRFQLSTSHKLAHFTSANAINRKLRHCY